MAASAADRPITIAMLALGGQGGGVLTGWLVDTAERNGFLAQSTYVAGVAQRTGATVYCVELYPESQARKHGRAPVFTPYPVPGDVDVVLAGEMAETGRAIQKGFVTPNCTTLIASSHRVYSISEKEALGDGILDQAPVAEAAENAAKQFICFDMERAANETGSIISAVMLGAIAAADVLPFSREDYEQTIRETGRAVEKNLAGFEAGFAGASSASGYSQDVVTVAAEPEGPAGKELAARIDNTFPENVRATALHGALRCLDYQDRDYAHAYLDVLDKMLQHDTDNQTFEMTSEVARQLALQMCYEDTIRVAELKTRADRTRRVRQQLAASDDQPVHVVEYFHPRIEEICDTLPKSVGEWVLASPRIRRIIAPLFAKGRNVRTSTITGYLFMRAIAAQKRWRRGSYRFSVQKKLIDEWLERVRIEAQQDYRNGVAAARSIETVSGYGDTYERGLGRYRKKLASISKADNRNAETGTVH